MPCANKTACVNFDAVVGVGDRSGRRRMRERVKKKYGEIKNYNWKGLERRTETLKADWQLFLNHQSLCV
jgi:hypothetical protein